MSDKQDKNIEQVAEETAAATDIGQASDAAADDAPSAATSPAAEAQPHPQPESGPEPESKPEPEPEPESAPGPEPGRDISATAATTPAREVQPAPVARKGSSVVAWLALLLVLALAAATAWLLREQQHRETMVVSRLQQLETTAGTDVARLDNLGNRMQGEIDDGLGKLESKLGELQTKTSSRASGLAKTLETLEGQVAKQREQLDRYSANDRQSWLMAEAEYLLRLANQRLIMAQDVKSAQALLASADTVLMELDDIALYPVRAAVAADLAAVRAVPAIDVEGIYLRLSALVEQGGKLVIFQLPEQEQQPREAPADGWQERLRQGYQQALTKLSNYIIIRRRDVPMQALMDPQWEGLVRQNMRMLLEQAQVALLSGNQTLYRESLQRAQHWVGEFFESDETAARAMSREITQLADLTVAVTMPDISGSLLALDDAIEKRQQAGGE